jgi:2-haloalkanoic acid dehalogenase type II
MQIRAIFFDFMGSCVDWHSEIVKAFPNALSEKERSEFALQWRQAFFDEIAAQFKAGLPPEDIDETHRRTLSQLLEARPNYHKQFSPEAREHAVQAWHSMQPWKEVPDALQKLKEKYEIFILANGTTRLQLDLTRSSGLQFNMLFSSELLGLTKPAPEIYQMAMELVKVTPQECVMVAAHAYDLRAAKAVGMKTVYIRRWTEDTQEDMQEIKKENDDFLEDMSELASVIDLY